MNLSRNHGYARSVYSLINQWCLQHISNIILLPFKSWSTAFIPANFIFDFTPTEVEPAQTVCSFKVFSKHIMMSFIAKKMKFALQVSFETVVIDRQTTSVAWPILHVSWTQKKFMIYTWMKVKLCSTKCANWNLNNGKMDIISQLLSGDFLVR